MGGSAGLQPRRIRQRERRPLGPVFKTRGLEAPNLMCLSRRAEQVEAAEGPAGPRLFWISFFGLFVKGAGDLVLRGPTLS